MKHILNNIPQEEKNRILEQHRGGKSIDTTRFKALLESTMGNVKPLISEEDAPVGTPQTKPTTGKGVQPANQTTTTMTEPINISKVAVYSDPETTKVLTNIDIDEDSVTLEGNTVSFRYNRAGAKEYGIGKHDCNTKNEMYFDGKPLSGTMYISDKRVDTLKSKCASNQGYASTNTGVDKNMA